MGHLYKWYRKQIHHQKLNVKSSQNKSVVARSRHSLKKICYTNSSSFCELIYLKSFKIVFVGQLTLLCIIIIISIGITSSIVNLCVECLDDLHLHRLDWYPKQESIQRTKKQKCGYFIQSTFEPKWVIINQQPTKQFWKPHFS